MNKFMLKIGEEMYEIEDLGKTMNSQFLWLYESHFSGRGLDFNRFIIESHSFFNQYPGDYDTHDRFFNNFYKIWFDLLRQKRVVRNRLQDAKYKEGNTI